MRPRDIPPDDETAHGAVVTRSVEAAVGRVRRDVACEILTRNSSGTLRCHTGRECLRRCH